MIDTTSLRGAAGSPTSQSPLHRPDKQRSHVRIFSSLAGIVVVLVALMWVMNLEATLPSIRLGDSTAGRGPSTTLEPGVHLAESPDIELSGNWFKQTLGTSVSAQTTSMVTSTSGSSMSFRFYGTDLSMTARVGPESGKVYVSVDGQASTTLPIDSSGSYLDLQAQQAENQTILIATGLAHRDHTVIVTATGNNQVAINSFGVSANTPFPWAFVFLYVSLTAALFVLIRVTAIAVCTKLGWL